MLAAGFGALSGASRFFKDDRRFYISGVGVLLFTAASLVAGVMGLELDPSIPRWLYIAFGFFFSVHTLLWMRAVRRAQKERERANNRIKGLQWIQQH